uniref:At4g15545-like C-terminal domain-containing protein n=1 Tax=Alexandrium monilatum TaxID=311494 RepID=A0A7S4QHW4_9DINO
MEPTPSAGPTPQAASPAPRSPRRRLLERLPCELPMGMEVKVGEGPLPQEHEDQMQLGIRIITSAFQNKTHSLEQEIRGLRLTCEEQRGNVAALQKKNSALEVELVESHQRSQQLAEENKELFKTVGSLRKQIARLENLKQAVLSSIQDDQEKEAGEPYDSRVMMSEDYMKGAMPLTAAEMGYGPPHNARNAGQLPGPVPPQAAPQQQPPLGHYDGHGGVLPQGFTETFTQPAGVAKDANGSSPVVDGKQFFRQARNRLSYDSFNAFLASIKRLNNQQQSREETLEEARRIFGPELQDLYKDFENLLNRHGM